MPFLLLKYYQGIDFFSELCTFRLIRIENVSAGDGRAESDVCNPACRTGDYVQCGKPSRHS